MNIAKGPTPSGVSRNSRSRPFPRLTVSHFCSQIIIIIIYQPFKREKENLLRVKCFTVQMKSEITQRHLFLGARSQHLGGGW